jgi:hypothetical protein
MVHRTVRSRRHASPSLAIYYRSVLNVHYLVHIFSLDVLSIPVLYTRHLDIYTDGGIAFSAGDSVWYFASDTSDDLQFGYISQNIHGGADHATQLHSQRFPFECGVHLTVQTRRCRNSYQHRYRCMHMVLLRSLTTTASRRYLVSIV